MAPLENSTADRFHIFRQGLKDARKLLAEIGGADAVVRAIKARTKTTQKGFQTEEQRAQLQEDRLYQGILQQLRHQINAANSRSEQRDILEQEFQTIESLTSKISQPLTRSESTKLKNDSGYKRLLAAADGRFKASKAALFLNCRREWRGELAEWFVAAMVLDESGIPYWPSLLGTGGNDGNLDFTNNFMQQIGTLFDVASELGTPRESAKELLQNSIWNEPTRHLLNSRIGQFQPGSAGGLNSSTGFAEGNLVNPWDFVLMMEGTVLFSCRATRRLDPDASSRASAPFAIRPLAAGFSTPGDEKSQRGEQWMPLWSQPATLMDLSALIGEARVQLNRQPASRPIDMARAVSSLGVARGISGFVRYAYLERNGKSNLAVPIGRIVVRHQSHAHLIDDLAPWLDRLQRKTRDKNVPKRLVFAERRLSDAVFEALVVEASPARLQAILIAASEIETIQASGTGFEAGPIPALRPDWIPAIDDGTAEVRLAMALGGAATEYSRRGQPIDPIRHHFLPLEPGSRRFRTADKRLYADPRVVVSGRDPVRDLISIVDRRLIESQMLGQRRLGLVTAKGCEARYGDLTKLLRGEVDLGRTIRLAQALMAVRWNRWSPILVASTEKAADRPEACWLAVRLACLPWRLSDFQDIPAEASIVRLLAAGDSVRAIDAARRRISAAGLRPPMRTGITDPATARLWAAALAFPINQTAARHAADLLDPSMKGKIYA